MKYVIINKKSYLAEVLNYEDACSHIKELLEYAQHHTDPIKYVDDQYILGELDSDELVLYHLDDMFNVANGKVTIK